MSDDKLEKQLSDLASQYGLEAYVEHDLTLRDIFEGRYPGDLGDPIAVCKKIGGFFGEWNAKMEYKFFGA